MEDMEPYRCAAGQVWRRLLRAPREVPKLPTLLVVCKSGIGPSVTCSFTWHTEHALFQLPVMLAVSAQKSTGLARWPMQTADARTSGIAPSVAP